MLEVALMFHMELSCKVAPQAKKLHSWSKRYLLGGPPLSIITHKSGMDEDLTSGFQLPRVEISSHCSYDQFHAWIYSFSKQISPPGAAFLT